MLDHTWQEGKKFQFYFGVLHLRLLGIALLNNGGVTTDWEM